MENQNEKLGQEPAFPTEPKQEVIGNKSYTFTNEMGNTEIGYQNVFGKIVQDGMSKRFYASCAAMQGILAGIKTSKNIAPDAERIIKDAYILADELLKQENI